jgi:nucleotide-binding universal stress UspA family protein
MFKKIVVAYDESPEAKRALKIAIDLAKELKSELRLVTVREPLPAYIGYTEAAFPGSKRILSDERHLFYENLQKEAKALASAQGIAAEGVIVEGDEIRGLIDDLESWKADLMVMGRRHHSGVYGRILSSTTHEVGERTRCSILAVL